jgi:type IV secretory pathway TraG/TraD family ATPase VirD4
MDASLTAQKKRPENSAGSAWLRGGQTIAHTADMIVELWRKLRWLLLLWAVVCWAIADHAAPNEDQVYAGLHVVAWLYTHIGAPLPDKLNVPDPAGVSHVVAANMYDALPFVNAAVDRYFGYMWQGFWLWLVGSIATLTLVSYAFIRSGDEKLESHDIRGQQIVPLRTLLELIRGYNLSKARDINQDTLRALSLPTASVKNDLLHRAYMKVRDVAQGFADARDDVISMVGRVSGKSSNIEGEVEALLTDGDHYNRLLDEVRANSDLPHAILKDRRWAEGRLDKHHRDILNCIAHEAADRGLPFYVRPSDFRRPTIGKVPYPYMAEFEHTLVVGGTGSGKSVAIHDTIDNIKRCGDSGVIYDPEGEFIRAHYREGIDLIFNPFDMRSVDWSPYMDLHDLTHWQSSAADLFPDPKTGDPYWTLATRTIYSYTGWLLGTKMRSRAGRNPTISELLALLVGPHDKLYEHLKNTPAANTLGEKAGPRSDSLRSVLITGAERLSHLLGTKENFSIRNWINDPNQRGFLFLSAPEDLAATIKPILAHLSSLTITALLSRDPEQSKKTTWIILDEFTSLGKMDSLADSPARLRKFGGCMVVGMQQVSQIEEIYGEPKARSIVGQLRNKLILACNDPRTGEFMSDLIGKREVRRIEETTSYGANNIRDGVGLAPKDTVEPIAMPEQIQRLPTRTGYIMFSPGQQGSAFPVSLVTYPFVKRPHRAPSFVPHNRQNPIEIHYLQQLSAKDESLGGLMTPPEAKGLPGVEVTGQQDLDKEATRDDVADLAPVESEAVRSAPHQALVEEGSVTGLTVEDAAGKKAGRAAVLPQADNRAILDSLNDMVNGPDLFSGM